MKTPLWLVLSLVLLPWPAHAAQPVGDVLFVIGEAQRVDADGLAHTLDAGAKVLEGDRIETGPGGHVHLRFIDQAFASVRPGSRLMIERYSFNPTDPASSAVRFTLDKGVVRSITGEAGKLRPDRYRLNTPLAAIGVRGTDFVARSDSSATQVLLIRGAVVVSTLGSNCAAQGFGPCDHDQAAVLSEANKGFIAQLRPAQPAPGLIALDPQQVLEMFGVGLQEPSAENGDRKSGAARKASRRGSASGVDWIDPDASYRALAQNAQVQVSRDGLAPGASAAAQAISITPAPNSGPAPLPLPPPSLVWGRWGAPAALPDALSAPYAEASAGRRITVGNQDYGLFRTEGDQRSLPAGLTGKADFMLTAASAQLVQGSSATAASVDGGRLQLDFSARSYATALNLSHPATGAQTLHSAGRFNDEGMFADKSAQQWVAGAVAQDGRSAGYFFEKQLPAGTFKGLTLWGQ